MGPNANNVVIFYIASVKYHNDVERSYLEGEQYDSSESHPRVQRVQVGDWLQVALVILKFKTSFTTVSWWQHLPSRPFVLTEFSASKDFIKN